MRELGVQMGAQFLHQPDPWERDVPERWCILAVKIARRGRMAYQSSGNEERPVGDA
jgi:hypothetical protein